MTRQAEPVLLDGYLPEYDVSEAHACVVNANVETTWAAVRGADLSQIGPVRTLLMLRAVPGRLRARAHGEPAPPAPPFTFADMPRVGFPLLAERPAEIAFGSVTRPWKVGDEQPVAIGPDAFAAFDEPGYAKIAFAIRADRHGPARTLVTTETRIATTDARSRQRFAAYWRVVGPVSALIRRLILRSVKAQVERGARSGRAARGC